MRDNIVSQGSLRNEMFEVEPEHECTFRLYYDLAADEIGIVLQPARRQNVTRTLVWPLTVDFDEDGQLLGMQLNTEEPPAEGEELDLPAALQPFRECLNISAENGVGYIHTRMWEPYDEEETTYAFDLEGKLDLAADDGLIAIRFSREGNDYELDPFLAFTGLAWFVDLPGGQSLAQFGQ